MGQRSRRNTTPWDPETTHILRTIFAGEAHEHLEAIGGCLLRFDSDPEVLGEFLRRVHTLKGSAGTVGYACLQSAAHQLEETLIALRSSCDLHEGARELLKACCDELRPMVGAGSIEQAEAHLQRFEALLWAFSQGESGIMLQAPLPGPFAVLGEREAGAPTEGAVLATAGPHGSAQRRCVRWLFARLRWQLQELLHSEGKGAELWAEGLELDLPDAQVEAVSDSLFHLLRNAVAHGIELPRERQRCGKPPQGKILLRFDAAEPGWIVLTMADDGAGVDLATLRRRLASGQALGVPVDGLDDAEVLDCIFLPGVSSRDRADAVAGRGLGLDVVRRSVQAAGGSVAVRSERGKGSSFCIRLPAPRDSVPTHPSAPRPLEGVRILVADDAPTVRAQLQTLLQGAGAAVEVACDGVEAWSRLEQSPFDLLISDVEMPRLNGLRLVQLVSAAAWGQGIKQVLISSRTGAGLRRAAQQRGVSLFLSKPVRDEALIEALAELVATGDACGPVRLG